MAFIANLDCDILSFLRYPQLKVCHFGILLRRFLQFLYDKIMLDYIGKQM